MTSNEPYKVRHIMQYTEMVYYDGDGVEIARDEWYDTHLYDVMSPEPLTDDEKDIYGIGGDDDFHE